VTQPAQSLEPWQIIDLSADCRGRGEFAHAEMLLRDCCARFPAHGPAAAALAHLLEALGRDQESLAAWRDVVRDFADALQPWWLVELARAERRTGNLAAAQRLLLVCRSRFPDHGPAAAAFADLLDAAGRLRDSRTAWRRVVSDFAGSLQPWWLMELAKAERRAGDLAAAERVLRAGRREFPAYGPAAAALADLLAASGRYGESRMAWREVLRDFADALQPWWLVEAARAERRLDHFAEAERLLELCRNLFAGHTPALAVLAELLLAQGRPAESDEIWRSALANVPDEAQPWWYVCAAAARRALERSGEAEVLLARMEAAFPDSPETLARRAEAAADAEDWSLALERWTMCLARQGAEARAEHVSARAWALFRLGRAQEALDAWTGLTARAPDYAPGLLAQASAAGELGRWGEVEDLFTRLIESSTGETSAELVVERLRARLRDRSKRVSDADIDDLVARFPASPHAHMLGVEFCFTRSHGIKSLAARVEAGLRLVPHNRWLRAEQVRILLAQGNLKAAQGVAASLAEDGDHHALISNWRVLADRQGDAALKAPAEQAVAQRWPLEAGLAVADFLLGQFTPWASALALRLLADLRVQFPGRPRLACLHARALIGSRQDGAAMDRIAALPDLCETAEALELRAWAAARAGDHRRAVVIWRRILGRSHIAALHSPAPRLELLTRGPFDDVEGVTAFSNMRNEMAHLPQFLRHHRRIGVRRFVIVDHGSDDGGAEYLTSQPDVILYRTRDGFQPSGAGMRWINWLSARHCGNGWRLEVDADEAFVYPGWETTPIDRFVAWLDSQGAEAVAAFMLDLFPKRLLDAKGDPTRRRAYRYYDAPYAWAGLVRPPYLQPLGGVRERLFQVQEMLHKVSLTRCGAAAYLGSHNTTPVRFAAVSGLLLHYKLFNLVLRRGHCWSAGGNPYMADRTPELMRRHVRYAARIGDLLGRDLFEPGVSAELADSLSLADRGLMRAPACYRDWLARSARER
jgi:tetratricopeptide (TPR) repeat protein